MEVKGRIFNIQRGSIYDGPGIRTSIFFKGCNLRCLWCHNPESISMRSELQLNIEKCIGCRACEEVCVNDVHDLHASLHTLARMRCKKCFNCIETCFAKALVKVGEEVTVEDLITQIVDDYLYFKNSNGGVTLTGGECMLQKDFIREFLKRCKQKSIHTAVDTAGNVPYSWFEEVKPYVDVFLYDIKAMNLEVHKELTGVGNEQILSNLRKLIEDEQKVIVRIPYIPTLNSTEMENIAIFLKQFDGVDVEILGYHKLGEGKYKALGYSIPGNNIPLPKDEELSAVKQLYKAYGIHIN